MAVRLATFRPAVHSIAAGTLRPAARRTAVTLAVAALAAGPLTAASAAPTSTTAGTAVTAAAAATSAQAATRLEQCAWLQYKPVGNGWTVPVPSVWESGSTLCNLKYGDLPHRPSPWGPFGDPMAAIKGLQRALNYCYGARLTVDGLYGSKTRAAVVTVQRRHRITVDGIYGPQTRSAMKWRLYHPGKRIWSSGCYSPL